jgi:hypothetical protein
VFECASNGEVSDWVRGINTAAAWQQQQQQQQQQQHVQDTQALIKLLSNLIGRTEHKIDQFALDRQVSFNA